MDKNLATIQVISDLQPIPNADKIEVAGMKDLAWKCVVKKGELKIGDLGVYICIDSIVPDKPEFEFLRNRNFRVKTIRLRKQLSQGLLLSLSFLPQGEYNEGQDVTEVVGVTHYEKPIPLNLRGQIRGNFPTDFVPKTDETMLQSIPNVLNEIKGKEVYISVKCDGTSATFANINGDIHVCSRNLSLKETEDNPYWKAYHKYSIDKVFEKFNNIAIQAELCGPGIQKNRIGLTDLELFVFNVYDITSSKYLDYADFIKFCSDNGLQTVPILSVVPSFDKTTDELLEMAKGTYASGQNREGIVIRPVIESYSPTIDDKYGMRGRMSFKVLNNEYLEKDEE